MLDELRIEPRAAADTNRGLCGLVHGGYNPGTMLRILCFFALTISAWAADVQVYFSPDGGCTDAIVKEIDAAKSEILVQAYSFTSTPIAKALLDANKRGVKITAIFDKENQGRGYSAASSLSMQAFLFGSTTCQPLPTPRS